MLDKISKALCQASVTSVSKGVLVHRLFDEEGTEIRQITQLKDEQKLWASRGEPVQTSTSNTLIEYL